VRDTLESISGDLSTKAQNIGFVIKNMESTAEQIKAHAKAMLDRAKALENRASNVKQYLFDGMKLANVPKIETPFFKLAIRDNPAAVQIDDESLIPASYKTEPVSRRQFLMVSKCRAAALYAASASRSSNGEPPCTP
jgi:hypothetical protein